jgi:hypothetical protein
MVEAGELGLGWISSDQVWAYKLQKLLDDVETNFVGVGLLFTGFASYNFRIIVVTRPDCPPTGLATIRQLASVFQPSSSPS